MADDEPEPEPGMDFAEEYDVDDYIDEEGSDDEDADDPDNPILARLQEALTKQLLDEDERITEELRVKDEDLRRAKKKREDIGADLYSVQQQLAKLQMQLESTHDRFKQVNKLREQVEAETAQAVEVYQQERQQVVQYKGKVDVNQVELDKVNSTIRQVQAYNEAMKDEVAVTRRATYKAEEATSELEKEKSKQDTLIDDLNQKLRGGTDTLGLIEAQLSAQAKETRAATETLMEAGREMEGIAFEKKHLMQQWKSSLIGMSRRDEALQKANEQIKGCIEAIQAMASEVQGFKREIGQVQEKNEALTAVLDKLDLDLKFTEKNSDEKTQKHQKLAVQYQQIRKALEQKDTDLGLQKKLLKQQADSIAVTQKRVQEIQNQTHVLDSKSGAIHSEQLTIEQGTNNTVKAAGLIHTEVQDLEMQVTQFENELARVRIDALNTQAHNDGLRQTLSSLDNQLKEKTELVDQYESEIRKRNDEIQKKQAEVDRLNGRYASLVGAQEAPEATGPLEATIYNLNKQIAAKNAENADMQKRWITFQTELVTMMNKGTEKGERLQELHSTIAILQQKRMRQEGALGGNSSEIKELEGSIAVLHQDMRRLNGLLAKNEELQAKLTDENFNMETDFVKKLKEMEVSSIEMEAAIQATNEEKTQLLNDIVEAEKQVMLWERKIQLEKETQATLDTGVGQDVIHSMSKEIHRMKLRLQALNRRQEELIKTMEGAIEKRGLITNRGRLTQLRGKDTAADLNRGKAEISKKISGVDGDVKKTETLIKDLDDRRADIGTEIDALGTECESLRGAEEEQGHRMEKEYWQKQKNLDLLLKHQRLGRRYEGYDESRAPGEETLARDWAREEGKANTIKSLVDRLNQSFPNLELGLDRIAAVYVNEEA